MSGKAEAAAPATPGAIGDELRRLIDDLATWLDAELSFQKFRASFALGRIKAAVLGAMAALLLGMLALIGLVAGAIIALTPLITGWGATAVVVGLLLLGAWLCLRRAARALRALAAVRRPPSSASEPAAQE